MRGSCLQQGRAAFTLLEVIVAIAVFAIGAVVLGSAYLGVLESYEAVSRGQHRDEDLRFARQLLLSEPDPKKAAEGGEFETPDRHRVKWSAEILPTALPDLFRVEFACEVEDGFSRRESRESFTVLRPTWSEAADRQKLRGEARKRIEEMNTEAGR